jgi:MYXO-CTERM domain-containing protein
MPTRAQSLWPCTLGALLLFAGRAGAAETIVPLAGEVPEGGPDHFFVEFEVPEGTLEIEVRHDDLSDANILDWGLDDPAGFRGWGGGNAEPAVVSLAAASRGYVPGAIEPGTWRVVVGKAKIEEPPGEYAIEVVLRDEVTIAPQPERMPYQPPAPLASEGRWYAGDFHVHSTESGDASAPLDDILAYAQSRGLDFVEITDHNVHTAIDFFGDVQPRHPEVLLLPGVEYTTYAGHANAIGATAWVDHKIGQRGVTIEAAVQAYRRAGAIVSLNHPTLDLGPLCIGCAWDHDLSPDLIGAIEIGNGGLEPIGGQFTPGAMAMWDELCAAGAHVVAIGGSDDHKAGVDPGAFGSPIGNPTTLVWAEELSVEGILAGIRAGRTVVKLQDPSDPMVELWPADPLEGDTVHAHATTLVATVTGGRGHAVRLVQDGEPGSEIAIDGDPFDASWEVTAPAEGQSRFRVEVIVEGRPRVVTSHVWLEDDASTPGDDTSGGQHDTGAETSGGAGSSTGAGDEPASTGSTGEGAADRAGGSSCACRSGDEDPDGQTPLVLALAVLGIAAARPRASTTT